MIDEIGKVGKKKRGEIAAIANFSPQKLQEQSSQAQIEQQNKDQVSQINQTDKVSFSDEIMRGEA